MVMTTMSSREFNQDTGRAKRAAWDGPVFITDRGRPSHVLLTFEHYQHLADDQGAILDLLSLPEGEADIELDLVRLPDTAQPAELT